MARISARPYWLQAGSVFPPLSVAPVNHLLIHLVGAGDRILVVARLPGRRECSIIARGRRLGTHWLTRAVGRCRLGQADAQIHRVGVSGHEPRPGDRPAGGNSAMTRLMGSPIWGSAAGLPSASLPSMVMAQADSSTVQPPLVTLGSP